MPAAAFRTTMGAMTEPEVEKVVLDTVRRYTLNDSAGVDSRFEQDLRMSEVGRQMLFASMAQAFSARGTSLASNGFFLRDFLACPTPAAVRDVIRQKLSSTGAPTPAPARPVAPAASPTPTPAAPLTPARKTKAKAPSKRASASKKSSPVKGAKRAKKRG